MKEPTENNSTPVLKKPLECKDEVPEMKFSTLLEDFVITEQEEKEGGFFNKMNSKATTATLK